MATKNTKRKNTMIRAGASEKAQVIREKLINIVMVEFNETGYEKISIEEIAKRVGIVKSGFFYYFPSKKHLLYHVFDRWLDIRMQRLENLMDISDPRELICAIVRDYVNLISQYHTLVSCYAYQRPPLEDAIEQQVNDKNRLWVHTMRDIFGRCQEAGVLPEADSRLLVETFFAPVVSIYHWYKPEDIPPEKMASGVLNILGITDTTKEK